MQRRCLKCGHANDAATGETLEACPPCGAIYSRVEAALAARSASGAGPASAPTPEPRSQSQVGQALDVPEFAYKMRSESLYPTFRNLVQLVYWLFIALAVIAAIGTVMVVFKGGGVGRLLGGLSGLAMTLIFLVLGRLSREMSLMLADLSDAAVRVAAKQEIQA